MPPCGREAPMTSRTRPRVSGWKPALAGICGLLAGCAAGYPASAETVRPSACAGPEHRQFDFWIGRWDVFDTKTGARAGSSVIERLYAGCALRENWSEDGFTGGSLNAFVGGQW